MINDKILKFAIIAFVLASVVLGYFYYANQGLN